MPLVKPPLSSDRRQALKESIIAGLHREGGWLVTGLDVQRARDGRYSVVAIVEERVL